MQGSYGSLSQLKAMMAAFGVRRLVVKRLRDNDNSKNQIYLGQGFEALNVLPFGEIYEDSSAKNSIHKARLNFYWLMPSGARTVAPNAQLILYPQYPEVRMSGFLKGAKNAPNNHMAVRQAGRILFFGLDDTGIITAAVVAPDDPVALEFEALAIAKQEQIFFELTVEGGVEDTKKQLISELRRISSAGWIDSKRLLPNGALAPCTAPQCGGYTLEAELGVRPNGFSKPDYMGWEVKQHSVSNLERPTSGGPVTLMTPEPTGGFYKEKGVEAFLRKYGYLDRRGREDRINFGGVHRVGALVKLTGLTMTLDGYDAIAKKLNLSKGITLLDAKGNPAAIWGYPGLIKHWACKHERAVYVPSIRREAPRRQYRYGNSVLLGEGADFFRFLKAMSLGDVYYDPGIKLEGASSKPRIKPRSQFRVAVRKLPTLYASAKRTDL